MPTLTRGGQAVELPRRPIKTLGDELRWHKRHSSGRGAVREWLRDRLPCTMAAIESCEELHELLCGTVEDAFAGEREAQREEAGRGWC